MNDILLSVLSGVGPWAIAVVALVVFAETGLLVGFFLPGDSMLFSVGVLIAAGAIHVPLVVVMVLLTLCAVAGDQVGYSIGRRYGPRVLNRPQSRLFDPRHVRRAEEFFDRHGPRAIILARFVPFARTFVPVLAGVGSMARRRFAAFNAIGALAWCVGLLIAGALLGGLPIVANHVDVISIALVLLSVAPIAIGRLRSRRRAAAGAPDESPAVAR